MKASDAIAKYLEAHGVSECFEMIGGMITHLVDSLAQNGSFNITSMHHEQSAAFAAEGVARKSRGKCVGLAMGTSGPGATNLITGIGSCWFDSVPCLFLTGQVNVSELKQERQIRQQGFQELDIASLVRPITKYAKQVLSADEILPEIHRALSAAISGRQGPVLIDIPNNLQREDLTEKHVEHWVNQPFPSAALAELDSGQLNEFSRLCRESSRPLFLIGGGAKWSEGIENLLKDLETACVPYVSTLMGQERIAIAPGYFGMIGSYGRRVANHAVQNCDLLIVIGARLDVRQTGSDVQNFAKNAKIIQIDIEEGQLNNRVKTNLSITSAATEFLNNIKIDLNLFKSMKEVWLKSLQEFSSKYNHDEYSEWVVSPFKLLEELSSAFLGQEVDYVCDVGNHQMWAAHSLLLDANQAIHHSGGMGAMGFALPAAIGISGISSGKTVVITGDGSFQVNIQELDTVSRLESDLLIIVLNNRSLGMVKNFQDTYFDGRNQSTKIGYSAPCFSSVAQAFGIESYLVKSTGAFAELLLKVKVLKRPVLIEVLMEEATECRPRLLFGNSIENQHPINNINIVTSY